jgi:DNA repair photolyase
MTAKTTSPTSLRETMNRKPVLYRDAKTVLNDNNVEFQEKLLCDGIIFNLGDACAYSCSFCYVGASMRYQAPPLIKAHNEATGETRGFEDVVIRRTDAVELLRGQLLKSDGKRRYPDDQDHRVVYSSTTVDIAANLELLKETAAACNLILDHTGWQIRLLSKSSLLHKLIADGLIPKRHHQRLIFGFSTGTLDDRVAKAFEAGTALVSKRLDSLHWLQDRGLRTFGMICPSLPQDDYDGFSREICAAIRVAKCEHVWAEAINLRGKSLTRTVAALLGAGLHDEAERMESVSGTGNAAAWEQYSRDTFLAHTRNICAEKLRYLQYIDEGSAGWWASQREKGAVLLGKVAKSLHLTTTPTLIPLTKMERHYLSAREKIVTTGVRASISAAKALSEIHGYEGGRLWNQEFSTFQAYCRARWEYGKSHSYRLVECGDFVVDLEGQADAFQSPSGDWLPKNEGQIRPLLALPKEHRVACWKEIVAETVSAEVTSNMVSRKAKQHAEFHGVEVLRGTPAKAGKGSEVSKLLGKLRAATFDHINRNQITRLLDEVATLID